MNNWLVILLVAISFLGGCGNNSVEPELEFNFIAKDKSGVEKSVFSQSDTVVLHFQILNRSSKDVLLVEEQIGSIDFFRVFKLNLSAEGNNEFVDMGRRYSAHHCKFNTGYIVPSHGQLTISLPWVPIQNDIMDYHPILCNIKYGEANLPQGEYISEFESSFKFLVEETKIEIPNSHFKIEFSIK